MTTTTARIAAPATRPHASLSSASEWQLVERIAKALGVTASELIDEPTYS